MTLQVNRFIRLVKEETSSEDEILNNFSYSAGYSLACMVLSILWIITVVSCSCGKRSRKRGTSHHTGKYLIYGLCFFALGGILLAVFQFKALIIYSCSPGLSQAYAITKVFFITAQVVLIACCSCGHGFSKSLWNGFFLYHTVITNVVLYLMTFLESKKDFDILAPSNETISRNVNCTVTSQDWVDLFRDSSLYLYPFFLEFTLTSSAMLAEFWMAADEPTSSASGGELQPLLEREQTSHSAAVGDGENSGRRKINVVVPSIIGILAGGSFLSIIFLLHSLSPANSPGNIYQIFYLTMSVVTTSLCIVGLVALRKHPVNTNSFGLDEGLLLTSVFGTFCLCLCSIYSAIFCLESDGNSSNSYASLTLTSSLMWIIQAALQSNFITKALHRKPNITNQCCGIFNTASLAIVLGVINFGLWAFNTIDLEGHYKSLYSSVNLHRLNELQNDFFGKSTWTWIMLVVYPLAIFYRIHSVSTFIRVYQLHKSSPSSTD